MGPYAQGGATYIWLLNHAVTVLVSSVLNNLNTMTCTLTECEAEYTLIPDTQPTVHILQQVVFELAANART